MSTTTAEPTSLAGQRVLITGGLGFIGSNLAHRCLELGARVTIYDCLDPRSGGNPYNIADIRGSVELCVQSILSFDHFSQQILDKDIVFKCAASTSHPFSMREPWMDLDANSRGVINVLEAVRRFNREVRLVHLGTTTQLGRLQYEPADERHPEFPTDIYSANKSVSEKYVLIYAKAYEIDATVVRLSNVFGPRASIHSPDFTFNNYFVGLALQDRDITVFGDGKQLRNVVYVDDAVEALVKVAVSGQLAGDVVFAAGDDHHNVAHIAEETVRCIGRGRVRYVEWPKTRRLTEPGDAVISNRKIKDAVKWAPVHRLADGLMRTRAYFEGCLDRYLR